jgi:ribosomal protein S12 methylthiotransferase accessory factor
VWALDITSDLGIPTVVALSRRVDGAPEKIIQGYGCHLDPSIAVSRALTEMNQMLMLVDRTPINPSFDPDNERWFRSATVANQPYLLPDPDAPATALDRPRAWSGDIAADVARCVDIVAAHGLETLVLDQTRPDIELNVVKVVVPGLRHFWARFAPGRLYDVPVQLGWLPRRLTEAELNPIPVSS